MTAYPTGALWGRERVGVAFVVGCHFITYPSSWKKGLFQDGNEAAFTYFCGGIYVTPMIQDHVHHVDS